VGEAAEYLASKTGVQVKTHGSSLHLTGVSSKELKFLVHKFLHDQGLSDYRVVIIHPELLEILSPKPGSSHGGQEEKGSAPTAPATMPYYFPGAGSFPSASKKSRGKKGKKR